MTASGTVPGTRRRPSYARPVPRRPTALAAAVATLVALVAGCSSGGDEASFCERLRSTDPVDAVLDRFDPDDPAGSTAAFREAAEDLDALAGDAPSEVADEVDVLAEAVGDLADGLADVPRDDRTGALAVLAGVGDRAAELQAAGEEVAAYAAAECGVTLGSEPAPPTTAPPTTAPPTTAPPTSGG